MIEQQQEINQNISNHLGSSMNLSLGVFASSSVNPSPRPIIQRAVKSIQTEQTQLVQTQAVWNGNRILQDYNGKQVFTTVYEAGAFVPLARLVWLEDKLTQAANDEVIGRKSKWYIEI